MKQYLFAVTSLLILSSATYGQSKWWVSSDSVNIFTRNTGGVMIGGVEPLGKLTVNGDRLGFNLALVGDYNNLSKNYLKIGVLGRASNGLDGHTLFDLYHSNGTLKKAGFNFRINEKSAFFINGEGNIGIGTEKPMAGLDITSGPDWGGFKKGLRLSANNAISVESGEMKYGMVGSENALHFFATNGSDKVNPFGSAFARLMSLQPKKVVIEGDLEVKGKIIYEGGQFTGGVTNTGGSDTGGSTTGAGTVNDGGGKSDGGTGGGGMIESVGEDSLYWKRNTDSIFFNTNYKRLGIGISAGLNSFVTIKGLGNSSSTSALNIMNSSNSSVLFARDDGNVGIGTTTPSYKLDVSGTSRFSGASTFQSGDVIFPGSGVWKSTGNVGIGVSNPGSKLEIGPINTANGGNIKLQLGSNYDLCSFNVEVINNRLRFYYTDGEISGNSKEVVSIINNGNVGIGTSTINDKLHVAGNIQSSANDVPHSFALVNSANSKDWRMIQLNSTDSQSPNGLLFEHQTVPGTVTRYMTLSQWGNLGISNNLTIDLTGKTSSAGRDALIINASADNSVASFITNKPGFYFWSSENGGHSADIGARNVYLDGSMGIGTSNPGTYRLAVNGTIKAKELYLTIDAGQWSDFVFDKNYKLRSLEEVDQFIKYNKHLPDISSEKELLDKGVGVVDMQAKLLQKIEELTLYMIKQDQEIQALKDKVSSLENMK